MKTQTGLLIAFIFVLISCNTQNSDKHGSYDKSSSGFSVLKDNGFVNDIDGGVVFWPVEIPDNNTLIGYAEAYDLIKHIKNDQMPNSKAVDRRKADHLKSIGKQFNENSNPVLIVLR